MNSLALILTAIVLLGCSGAPAICGSRELLFGQRCSAVVLALLLWGTYGLG